MNQMCISCKGKLSRGMTDYVENNKSHVVLIRDVPCDKCGQCGEAYFDHSTVQVIERILDGIQPVASEITLTVMDYTKNTA